MAGFEKICELTGVHYGNEMYDFKRNHIQIASQHRKLFRHADHTLKFEVESVRYVTKSGSSMFRYDYREFSRVCGQTFRNQAEADDYAKHVMGMSVRTHYRYTLLVTDPKLKGRVNGRYIGYTFCKTDVIRRLGRMFRQSVHLET